MGKPSQPTKHKNSETSRKQQKLQPSKASPKPEYPTTAINTDALCENPTRSEETATSRISLPTSRSKSKLSKVIEMLRAPEGVSIADIMKATDWQAHSVRGAIAGAIKKKLGLSVISERRGDERFYRIAE